MIASFGMALRYSYAMIEEAELLDRAIAAALDAGRRTADIWTEGMRKVSTAEMGKAIVGELERLSG
jgi:3-isopropylmalate dehydrogenase